MCGLYVRVQGIIYERWYRWSLITNKWVHMFWYKDVNEFRTGLEASRALIGRTTGGCSGQSNGRMMLENTHEKNEMYVVKICK